MEVEKHVRAGLKLTVRQASIYVAATLIDAALHFFFAGLPLSSVPLDGGMAVSIQPSVVVPIFVGLTAGPLGGALVGLAGRFLGDLLAGQGINGFGLIYSGVLGLAAGLGYRRLSGYSTLRHVLIALGCTALACVAASLVATLLVQTFVWRDLTLTAGLNRTLSQIVSSGIMALLLISTPLYVWGRTKTGVE
jgi:uncharacterized membrane protein